MPIPISNYVNIVPGRKKYDFTRFGICDISIGEMIKATLYPESDKLKIEFIERSRKYEHIDDLNYDLKKGNKGPSKKYYYLTNLGQVLFNQFINRNIKLFYSTKIKKILTIGLILIGNFCLGQNIDQVNKWIYQLENPTSDKYVLKADNLIDKYKTYNFSTLMIPKSDFIGYIGDDYKRIYIYFTSIIKDTLTNDYKLTGLSLVGNNKCEFEGIIKVKQIREFENMHFGVDEIYKNEGIKAQGLLIGEYHFKEDIKQQNSGEFIGVMTLYWYIDRFDILHYDDIEWYSDNYKNNQYIGIWRDYNNGSQKICNWGERRIPFSGDLDIGVGEFSPNPKYKDKGWKVIEE